MNKTEAINELCGIARDKVFKLSEEQQEAILIAVDSLKKQIPRKPNKVRRLNGQFSYLCPTCGGGLMSMCRCHYAECGQAIEWSDNE